MDHQLWQYFDLTFPFTKNELKTSLKNKILLIKNNNNINNYEKKMLIEKYYEYYNICTNYIKDNVYEENNIISTINPFSEFNNIFNIQNKIYQNLFNSMNNLENNIQSKSESYSYISNSIGNSRIILEKQDQIMNGKKSSKNVAYKIDSKGNKMPLEYNEAIKELNKNNYLINNS